MHYDNSLSLNVYHTIRSCLKVASYWYNSWNQTRVSQYRRLLRPIFLAGTCRMLCYLWNDWLIVIGYQSNMRYVLVWAGVMCNTFPDIFLSLYFSM